MVATIVKTIGTTGNVSTPQAWEDAAPVDLTTAERWTAGTFTGTFQLGEAVSGTGLTTGKFLASDGASYVAFGIVTGNSLTLTTLTGGVSGATCVVSTKTDTGVIWQGQCKNQSFTVASGTLVAMSGSTSSATCYKELTTVAGASFRDNANVQTNALRFNTANGAALTDSYYLQYGVNLGENYARLNNLQVAGGGTYGSPVSGIATTDINNCILEGVKPSSTAGTIRNSLIVMRASSAAAILNLNAGAAYSCTIVCPSNFTAATAGVSNSSGTASTVENCAIFGVVGVNTNSFTFTTCRTNVASPPAGCTTVAYDTTTGSGFQNITDATRDYRLASTSALINVGTTDSTNAANDIAGTARPSGAAYDVGAWEYVSAGGGSTVYYRRTLSQFGSRMGSRQSA